MDALIDIVESSESDCDDDDEQIVEYGADSPDDMFINHQLPTWKALLFRTSSSLGMQVELSLQNNKD